MGEGDGGGEGFARFGHGIAGADGFPELLSGLGIEGEDVAVVGVVLFAFLNACEIKGFVALKDLNIEAVLREHEAACIRPLNGEAPVVLLHIGFPNFLAAEIKGDQIPGAKVKDGQRAIGDG